MTRLGWSRRQPSLPMSPIPSASASSPGASPSSRRSWISRLKPVRARSCFRSAIPSPSHRASRPRGLSRLWHAVGCRPRVQRRARRNARAAVALRRVATRGGLVRHGRRADRARTRAFDGGAAAHVDSVLAHIAPARASRRRSAAAVVVHVSAFGFAHIEVPTGSLPVSGPFLLGADAQRCTAMFRVRNVLLDRFLVRRHSARIVAHFAATSFNAIKFDRRAQ